ncbi:hypothetical protein ACU4GD_15460 [Cupriavidus basilensis]
MIWHATAWCARTNVTETEDHIATLCEVMRLPGGGRGRRQSPISPSSSTFFAASAVMGGNACAIPAAAHPQARFYVHVAGLLKAFMAVEAIALDMH